jgi:hypothetical protein
VPDNGKPSIDAALYPLLDELDRLEDLLEEMDDLGVASRADVERRMADLNDEIDRLSGA